MTEAQYIKNLQVPKGKIDAVLDTDTYNEIDDQFALAYLLRCSQKISVAAVFAAPFLNSKSNSPEDGMLKSYDEINKVMGLMNRRDVPVFRGSASFLPDEKTPVASDAANHLVKLAKEYSPEHPLYVVAIGAITNVASALLIEPSIKENIVIVWLGGHSLQAPDTAEFNMEQDVAAARIVFGCGAPLVQLPCADVVEMFRVTRSELVEFLEGKNPGADYLAVNTIKEADSYAKGKPWSRVIWDVTAVAWLVNDNNRFMKYSLEHAPIPEYDNHYGFNRTRHLYSYVYHINRDNLMTDLFEKILEVKL